MFSREVSSRKVFAHYISSFEIHANARTHTSNLHTKCFLLYAYTMTPSCAFIIIHTVILCDEQEAENRKMYDLLQFIIFVSLSRERYNKISFHIIFMFNSMWNQICHKSCVKIVMHIYLYVLWDKYWRGTQELNSRIRLILNFKKTLSMRYEKLFKYCL